MAWLPIQLQPRMYVSACEQLDVHLCRAEQAALQETLSAAYQYLSGEWCALCVYGSLRPDSEQAARADGWVCVPKAFCGQLGSIF